MFDSLYRHGFLWEEFNSNDETARTAINSLEEVGYFPAFILNGIKRRLDPYYGYLCFKLDWLLGKNIQGLADGQVRDPDTGVLSVDPGCLRGENSGPDRISDHLPIYADLNLG